MASTSRLAPLPEVLRATIAEYRRDRASLLGAAIALYGVLGLAPLALLLALLAQPLLGAADTRQALIRELDSVAGPNVARALDQALAGLVGAQIGTELGLLSLLIAFYAAIRLFSALQIALNVAWNLRVRPWKSLGRERLALIARRVLAFSAVTLLGLLLVVSTFVSATLGALVALVPPGPVSAWTLRGADLASAFLLGAVAVAAIFRLVPDARVSFADLWIGALATSAAFQIGRLALGAYFAARPFASGGPAGALIAVLLWAQYSAALLVMGAELTQVLARKRGGPRPLAHAEAGRPDSCHTPSKGHSNS